MKPDYTRKFREDLKIMRRRNKIRKFTLRPTAKANCPPPKGPRLPTLEASPLPTPLTAAKPAPSGRLSVPMLICPLEERTVQPS